MWLPPDERRLLVGFYARIGQVGDEVWFRMHSWSSVLEMRLPPLVGIRTLVRTSKAIPAYGEPSEPAERIGDVADLGRRARKVIELDARRKVAECALEARGLVKIRHHQSELSVSGVELTIEGYDIGRKYASWFSRTGEWFREYKDHWVWLLASLLGGAIAGGVVSKLM